jgi:hypothetical protein
LRDLNIEVTQILAVGFLFDNGNRPFNVPILIDEVAYLDVNIGDSRRGTAALVAFVVSSRHRLSECVT